MFEKLDVQDKFYLAALPAFKKEDYDTAIKILSVLVENNPQDFESIGFLADCYNKTGDPIRTVLALKAAQKLEPRNAKILAYLGSVYSRNLFLHELAIHILKQVLELDQSQEDVYVTLAYSYCLLKNKDEAIKICREGLSINPSWNGSLYLLGLIHLDVRNIQAAMTIAEELKVKDYPHAADLFKRIEEDDPEKDEAIKLESNREAKEHFDNANKLSMKGEFKAAFKELISALESDPEFAIAYTTLGKILDDHNLIDEGISLHKRAIELDPTLAMAYNNLAYGYTIKEENEQAVITYKKALGLNPSLVEAQNSLGYLYDKLGDYEKGLSHFEAAFKIDPNRPKTLFNLLWVYKALGRQNDALAVHEKISKMNPEIILADIEKYSPGLTQHQKKEIAAEIMKPFWK